MVKKLTPSKMSKTDLMVEIDEIMEKMQKKDLLYLYKMLAAGDLYPKDSSKAKIEKPKINIKLIDDPGIKEKQSNGGRTQTLLFKVGKVFWKLIIHSESYSFQSYIRLYSGDGVNNWIIIKSGNPKKDYNIDIAYHSSYSKLVFNPIIEDYKKIILKMSEEA